MLAQAGRLPGLAGTSSVHRTVGSRESVLEDGVGSGTGSPLSLPCGRLSTWVGQAGVVGPFSIDSLV